MNIKTNCPRGKMASIPEDLSHGLREADATNIDSSGATEEEEEGIEQQVDKFFEELNIEEGKQRKRFRKGLRVRDYN